MVNEMAKAVDLFERLAARVDQLYTDNDDDAFHARQQLVLWIEVREAGVETAVLLMLRGHGEKGRAAHAAVCDANDGRA